MSRRLDAAAVALGLAAGVAAALVQPPDAADRRPPPLSPALQASSATVAPEAPTRTLASLPPSLQAEEQAWTLADKLAALDSDLRDALLPPLRLLALLDVRPGMRVADVGAGSGRLAVPLARAVGPGGEVLATDVDAEMIAHLRRLRAQHDLPALRPLLVKGEDAAVYPGRAFDLIVACSVLEYLRAPTPFLRQLAAGLAPGGRLALLQGRVVPHLLATDVAAGFDLAALRDQPRWRPLWRRLDADLQAQLATPPAPPPALAAALAQTLTDALADAALFPELIAAAHGGDAAKAVPAWLSTLSPEDATVAGWIIAHQRDEGGAVATEVTGAAELARKTLGFLALTPLFRHELARELYPRGIYLRPERLRQRAEALGLRALPTPPGLVAHDLLLFERPR